MADKPERLGTVTDGDDTPEIEVVIDPYSGQVELRMEPDIAHALADHLAQTAGKDVGFREMAAALRHPMREA